LGGCAGAYYAEKVKGPYSSALLKTGQLSPLAELSGTHLLVNVRLIFGGQPFD
jgi:hypothetical protein